MTCQGQGVVDDKMLSNAFSFDEMRASRAAGVVDDRLNDFYFDELNSFAFDFFTQGAP